MGFGGGKTEKSGQLAVEIARLMDEGAAGKEKARALLQAAMSAPAPGTLNGGNVSHRSAKRAG